MFQLILEFFLSKYILNNPPYSILPKNLNLRIINYCVFIHYTYFLIKIVLALKTLIKQSKELKFQKFCFLFLSLIVFDKRSMLSEKITRYLINIPQINIPKKIEKHYFRLKFYNSFLQFFQKSFREY